VNCERCGHPHSQPDWDQLFLDWRLFYQNKKGYTPHKAFIAAHREMLKHGPRPDGPRKPPLWLRLGAKLAGEGESMKKLWNWFSGKKTVIGAVLLGVPVIWEAVVPILSASGVNEAKVVAITGVIATVVGLGHKVVKAVSGTGA